jgi:catechol 1,2-dioxygenase
MIVENEKQLTEFALDVMKRTPDARLREITTALVKHLHAFVRETRLTEREFQDGCAVIAELGQHTNDRHNEVVLMAGSLGVSSLVCLLNNGDNGNTETNQNLLGPFWRMHSPGTANGETINPKNTPGTPMFVKAVFTDTAGKPIEGAEVDVWQADDDGFYENQLDLKFDMNLRGKFHTDAKGEIAFRSIMPLGYPIPTGGPVGRMLIAQERHPYRPAHLHFLAAKPGFKTLISQVYDSQDPRIQTDAQFGVTRALVGDYKRHSDNAPAADVTGEWISLDYAFKMEKGESRLPRPPIK